jgi:hypothetical protein
LLLHPRLPPGLLSQADEGPNSRERVFSVRRTFFGFLYQVLKPDTSCREIVRQIQALFALQDQRRVDENSSGYCQARKRLPLDTLSRVRVGVAAAGETTAELWHGLRPKLIDGTTVSAPDTSKNQRAYPQSRSQKPGCGFPLIRLVGVFSLATGVLLDYAKGNKHQPNCGSYGNCSTASNPATWCGRPGLLQLRAAGLVAPARRRRSVPPASAPAGRFAPRQAPGQK